MRRKKIGLFRLFPVILLLLISSCRTTQTGSADESCTGPAELLRSGVYGPRTLQGSSAAWITDPTTLNQVYTLLDKYQTGKSEALTDIDFDTYGILFIEMGRQPTGGYSIDFVPSQSRVVEKKAFICISWNTPKVGAVLTQVVTSPFMLLKICRSGIASIVVIDQNERPLFETAIN